MQIRDYICKNVHGCWPINHYVRFSYCPLSNSIIKINNAFRWKYTVNDAWLWDTNWHLAESMSDEWLIRLCIVHFELFWGCWLHFYFANCSGLLFFLVIFYQLDAKNSDHTNMNYSHVLILDAATFQNTSLEILHICNKNFYQMLVSPTKRQGKPCHNCLKKWNKRCYLVYTQQAHWLISIYLACSVLR